MSTAYEGDMQKGTHVRDWQPVIAPVGNRSYVAGETSNPLRRQTIPDMLKRDGCEIWIAGGGCVPAARNFPDLCRI